MNKQYKVIWSKVKHSYVVVSELAKQNGKAASTHIQSGHTFGVALSVLALCVGLSGVAQAETMQGNAMAAEVTGAFSSINTQAPTQGAGATIYGPVNIVNATNNTFDGTANSLIGVANATKNANATLIFGAGNRVENAYGDVKDFNPAYVQSLMKDPDKLSTYLASKVGTSGGQILVIGGANTAKDARFSSITGVSNRVLGTTNDTSDYNFVSGARNIVSAADHAYVIGTDNAVDKSSNNVLIGDNRTLLNMSNSVVLGSGSDPKNRMTTREGNVVVVGYEANAMAADSISIGSKSIANIKAGVAGYNPNTKKATTQTSATWKSTLGSFSVGTSVVNSVATGTRQITGVAAGFQDTDAVNIGQLKALQEEIAVKRNAATETIYSVNTQAASGSKTVALGKDVFVTPNNAVAIGNGAWIRDSGGTGVLGSGDIAIGNGAKIDNYADQSAGISIGQKSFVENMTGRQEEIFSFGQTTFRTVPGTSIRMPNDPSKLTTGIAIGENAYARSGSTMIGAHKYNGKIGDITLDVKDGESVKDKTGMSVNTTAIGTNSYSSGAFSTVIGTYSIASGSYRGMGDIYEAAKNFGSNIVGSLNSIESASSNAMEAGIASSVVGFANRTNNVNGALVFGAGNEITNSIGNLSIDQLAINAPESAKAMQDMFVGLVKRSDGGGATLAIGGGNKADYTKASALIGVNNTLKGTDTGVSKYNSIMGYNNTAETVSNVTVTGINNNVKNTKTAIVLGDRHTVIDADNSVVIGSADTVTELKAADATVIGHNANVKVATAVALGSGSVASVDKGVFGFDPKTGLNSTTDNATWKATLGSVSVGDVANNYTRQITGVAAGTADTDAVNVAQLKQVQLNAGQVAVVAGDNVKVKNETANGITTYTVTATDTKITGASYKDGTLTINQSEGTPITVSGFATNSGTGADAIHYFSIKVPQTPGGNYNNDGATGDNALAVGVGAKTAAHNSVAVGNGAIILESNGGKGSGDIAIGNGAQINNYGDQSAGISIGQNAFVENMVGQQEAMFALGQTTYSGNVFSGSRIPKDPTKVATGLAIGENAYARTGSVMIGTHKYMGKLGDVDVNTSTGAGRQSLGTGVNATTVGTNSFNNGSFSTVTGAYSIATSDYSSGGNPMNAMKAGKNLGATIMGSLNSVESATAASSASGIGNSIVGVANKTANTNGSLIFGAGNEITNSIVNINVLGLAAMGVNSAKDLQDKMKDAVGNANGGGATLAIGGANKADYTRASSIIGVKNTLKGTNTDVSEYNSIMGYNNTAETVSNVTVTGINNTVKNTKTAIVLGDGHTVTGANNSVVIGSADTVTELKVADATVIGHNANVTVATAIALGSNSVASVDKGILGYIPTGKTLSDADKGSATWTSTLGALSIGDVANGKTRQITGVAAGTADTDAVNVAQLKQIQLNSGQVAVVAGDNVMVDKLLENGVTTYTVAATDTKITGASYSNGTLTINQSKGGPITVTGFATGNNGQGAAQVVSGKNIKVTADNKVNLNDEIILGHATDTTKQVNINGEAAKVTAGSGAGQVVMDGSAASVKAGEGANQVAIDGKSGQITLGEAGKQIVIGNQTVTATGNQGQNGQPAVNKTESGQFMTGLANTTWDPDKNGYVADRAATEGQLKAVADKINQINTNPQNATHKYIGDEGATVTVNGNDALQLAGGADVTKLSDGNIGVVVNKDNKGFDIKLSKELKNLDSVTTNKLTVNQSATIGKVNIEGDVIKVGEGNSQTIINNNSVQTGNTTVNNDGVTIKGTEAGKDITINNNNVNMGGNQIHNIGEATEATDAVNKVQLDKAVSSITNGIGEMSHRISKIDRRVDRVGAGAAALAALHPLDYSPEAKWEVSAGVGNYKGSSALALGAFYRPNGDTMFSIGTSLGGGENMVNAGVTLRVGDGNTESYPARKVMAQQIKDLQSVVNTQNEKIEQLTQLVNTLVGANQQIQPVVSAPQAEVAEAQ